MEPCGPNLLLLLDPKLRLFDEVSVSDSDISILSDPFSDNKIEAAIAPSKRKDLAGRDVFEAFEFSPKLRSAMIDDEEGRYNISTMLAETSEHIRAKAIFTQIRRRVPIMVQIKVGALLNDRNIHFGIEAADKTFVPDEKKTWEDLKDELLKSRSIMRNIKRLTEREKSRKLLQAQKDQEAYETMSGYWRLLTGYEEFNFSPPGYDAYMGRESHWLETEPIPWTVIQASREKVLNWFSNYFKR